VRRLALVEKPEAVELDKAGSSLLNAWSRCGAEKESFPMAEPEADLSKKYDAVIIGSGAAGGMAAHVLTSHGLQVLLLEAGKKLNLRVGPRAVSGRQDKYLGQAGTAALRLRFQGERSRRVRRKLADQLQRHCSLLR
jgi:NADPH-dependent 2,4-dienoyl-CoA reductase/sulfur reductase-like enzyme